MNALMESAKAVDGAWCKGSLKKEADSREAGDTYCAAGLLVKELAKSQGLDVSWSADVVGTGIDLNYWGESEDWYADWMRYDGNFEEFVKARNALPTFEYLNTTTEARVLAETIIANYYDRVDQPNNWGIETLIEKGLYSHVIFQFNDHQDTTREEVVAMMEKAGVSYDDAVAFEDKTSDDLVAEIDELLNA